MNWQITWPANELDVSGRRRLSTLQRHNACHKPYRFVRFENVSRLVVRAIFKAT